METLPERNIRHFAEEYSTLLANIKKTEKLLLFFQIYHRLRVLLLKALSICVHFGSKLEFSWLLYVLNLPP